MGVFGGLNGYVFGGLNSCFFVILGYSLDSSGLFTYLALQKPTSGLNISVFCRQYGLGTVIVWLQLKLFIRCVSIPGTTLAQTPNSFK